MTNPTPTSVAPLTLPPASPRVRIGFEEAHECRRRPCPPKNEDRKDWWIRLRQAMGSSSADFISAALYQIRDASQLPGGGVSELGVNAALAIIESAGPRNAIEAVCAIQLACTHAATMIVLSRLQRPLDRHVAVMASAAARLSKATAVQIETLRRLKGNQQQLVRVEHVHVHEGAQAVIGSVSTQT